MGEFKPGINIKDIHDDLLSVNGGAYDDGNWQYRVGDDHAFYADIFNKEGDIVATTKIGITLEFVFSKPRTGER